MEKSSIRTSVEVESRVKSIPLPNQLPPGLDFSGLPAHLLKTSTLETLIQQNEDLMARLSVSLRKNGEWEDKVALLERDTQNLRARFENYKEQVQVAEQKERLSAKRTRQLHDENVALREQVAKLERGYTEVFVQAQTAGRKLAHLRRYRVRVKHAAMGLKAEVQRLRALRDQFRDAHKMSQTYEAKLAEAHAELEGARAKAEAHDRVFEEKLQLENQRVLESRQAKTKRDELHQQLATLAKETANQRSQIKDLLVERETKALEFEAIKQENPTLRQENERLKDQVESLQALWNHKQRELELTAEKNVALQKLNQNLGVTMNQQRRELQSLKGEMESERLTQEDRIRTLLQEIQMLRSGP